MYNLACCYADGHGVQEDGNKASRWFSEAARRGYAPAVNDPIYGNVKSLPPPAAAAKYCQLLYYFFLYSPTFYVTGPSFRRPSSHARFTHFSPTTQDDGMS